MYQYFTLSHYYVLQSFFEIIKKNRTNEKKSDIRQLRGHKGMIMGHILPDGSVSQRR